MVGHEISSNDSPSEGIRRIRRGRQGGIQSITKRPCLRLVSCDPANCSDSSQSPFLSGPPLYFVYRVIVASERRTDHRPIHHESQDHWIDRDYLSSENPDVTLSKRALRGYVPKKTDASDSWMRSASHEVLCSFSRTFLVHNCTTTVVANLFFGIRDTRLVMRECYHKL